MSWFDDDFPRRCRLDNRVFLHTDGLQYVCHGCPYCGDARFRTGTYSDGHLAFIREKQKQVPDKCMSCDASYCVYCNMAGMPAGDLCNAWNMGCGNAHLCEIYRVFAWYRRALIYALTKGK